MTPTPDAMARVLDAAQVTLSVEVQKRSGGLGPDPVLLFEVRGDETKVLIGERAKMREALIADGIIDANASHFLAHAAPRGFVWLVIDWGDEVSTLLHSVETPLAPDRRVS